MAWGVYRDGHLTKVEYIRDLRKGDILPCRIDTPRSYKEKLVKLAEDGSIRYMPCIKVTLIDSDREFSKYQDPAYRIKTGDSFYVRIDQLRPYYSYY